MNAQLPPHQHANNIPSHPSCDWCRGCIVGLCMALAGCSSAPKLQQPLNLSQAKAAVTQYQESGAYARDLSRVASEMQAWVEARVAKRSTGEKLAVVFDIDETLLSNAPIIARLDYAYLPAEWEIWVASAEAPAIEPVKAVYKRCLELGVEVFLITGRKEPSHRAPTIENLRRQGLDHYAELILAQAQDRAKTTIQRKSAARAEIEQRGYVIIGNIGDQDSDLIGGHSERTFKLQNPFYLMN